MGGCDTILITKSGVSGRYSERDENLLPNYVKQEERDRQEENGEDHNGRRADELVLAGPRDLVHLRFDSDQEIGKSWPIDDSITEPGTSQKQDSGNRRGPKRAGVKISSQGRVERPAAERNDHPDRKRRQLPDNTSLVRLVHRSLKKLGRQWRAVGSSYLS